MITSCVEVVRRLALLTAAALWLAACGGGSDSPSSSPPPSDTTPPVVVSNTPAAAATGVATNIAISATFSEAMNNSTLTTSTFTVIAAGSATPISGAVSVGGNSVTLAPAVNLAHGTQYTATITTGVRDSAGNALASNFSWSFTTTPATPPSDTTPPTVIANFPANAATGIAPNSAMLATFSEAMNSATLTSSTFIVVVTATGAPVSGTLSTGGNTTTFTPATNLLNSTQYTATITTGARDVAGNALASAHSWSFTTATPADATPPTVIAVTPANNATDVAVSTALTATFSEAMNNGTLNTSSFSAAETSSSTAVSGSLGVSGNTATFTPGAPLSTSTQYTATINTAVRDVAGNNLTTPFTWSFTTANTASPSLGAHSLNFSLFSSTVTQVQTAPMTTQTTGSVIVTGLANGTLASLQPPTDNKGNSYSQRGASHAYSLWPTSGTAIYAATTVSGGANHVVTEPQLSGEELTVAAIEVRNASTVNAVWREVLSNNLPLTSATIDTTGPAVLIAFWWGDADGSEAHTAVPDNGFTVIDRVLQQGSLVQCAVATRTVTAAGTYSVTWTSTPTQGAQLWLIAVQ